MNQQSLRKENNRRSWRFRDSELAFSSLLIIELNSINLASFLRSSFGFPKKVYVCPSVPRIDIFLGLARDRIISISSKNSAIASCKKKWVTLSAEAFQTHLETSADAGERADALIAPQM